MSDFVKDLTTSIVDMVEKVEAEHNLKPGELMQAWVDEYNSRLDIRKQLNEQEAKKRKEYKH